MGTAMTNSLPAKAALHPPAEDVVQLVAQELAAEIADHIEQMYPQAVEAAGAIIPSVRAWLHLQPRARDVQVPHGRGIAGVHQTHARGPEALAENVGQVPAAWLTFSSRRNKRGV